MKLLAIISIILLGYSQHANSLPRPLASRQLKLTPLVTQEKTNNSDVLPVGGIKNPKTKQARSIKNQLKQTRHEKNNGRKKAQLAGTQSQTGTSQVGTSSVTSSSWTNTQTASSQAGQSGLKIPLVTGSSQSSSISRISKVEQEANVDPNQPLTCFNMDECKGHHIQGYGGVQVAPSAIKAIGAKLGLMFDFDAIRAKLGSQLSPYPRFAVAGIVVALALAAKLKLVPATQFADQVAASKHYGKLKLAGINRDAATIKQLVGDTKGLTDAELITLWGQDEHVDLHSSFTSKNQIFQAAHMTSINSWLKPQKTLHHGPNGEEFNHEMPPTPNAADFPAGGANNNGFAYEPGWFEACKSIGSFLG